MGLLREVKKLASGLCQGRSPQRLGEEQTGSHSSPGSRPYFRGGQFLRPLENLASPRII